MKTDKNLFRVEHILDSIQKIEFILKDLTYDKFKEDWQSQDIIIRNLEIIGEACRHIDENIKSLYPEVAWLEANSMRNVLIHEYFGVSPRQVWLAVTEDIPILKKQILKIKSDLTTKP